jgi:hypothetical protein
MMNPPPSSDFNYLHATLCYTPPERNLFVILFCETSPVSKITRIKITRNSWKPKNEQYQFQVVSRDFDKPAAFLAALGAGTAFSLQFGLETFFCHS